MPTLPTCIQHSIGSHARETGQKNKSIQDGKEEVNPLFADYMKLHIGNPKDSTKKWL